MSMTSAAEEPMVRRLCAGGRWIRTSCTAAQKRWISAALRGIGGALKRYHRIVQPFSSAFRTTPSSPAGHGLWLAGLRSGLFIGRPFCEFGPAVSDIELGVLGRHFDRAIETDIDVPAREGLYGAVAWRRLQANPKAFRVLRFPHALY